MYTIEWIIDPGATGNTTNPSDEVGIAEVESWIASDGIVIEQWAESDNGWKTHLGRESSIIRSSIADIEQRIESFTGRQWTIASWDIKSGHNDWIDPTYWNEFIGQIRTGSSRIAKRDWNLDAKIRHDRKAICDTNGTCHGSDCRSRKYYTRLSKEESWSHSSKDGIAGSQDGIAESEDVVWKIGKAIAIGQA